MLDDKKLNEIRRAVTELRNAKEITKDESNKKFVDFYLENALTSLNTAKILDKISSLDEIKKQFDFITSDFESYLWIINSSYYSMFYMAGALLAKLGMKVKAEMGIHKKTYYALIVYLSGKLAKQYIEDFKEALEESQELLASEKAHDLMEKYSFEMEKRVKFTYNIGVKAKENKAATSLKRAVDFYNEGLRVLDRFN